jgi:hypothetical protein
MGLRQRGLQQGPELIAVYQITLQFELRFSLRQTPRRPMPVPSFLRRRLLIPMWSLRAHDHDYD